MDKYNPLKGNCLGILSDFLIFPERNTVELDKTVMINTRKSGILKG